MSEGERSLLASRPRPTSDCDGDQKAARFCFERYETPFTCSEFRKGSIARRETVQLLPGHTTSTLVGRKTPKRYIAIGHPMTKYTPFSPL